MIWIKLRLRAIQAAVRRPTMRRRTTSVSKFVCRLARFVLSKRVFYGFIIVLAIIFQAHINTLICKVAFYEETENGYNVILQYAGKDYKLYSQAIEVTVKENTDVTPPTSSETPNNSSESTGDQQGSATQSNQNQAVGCGASAGAGLLGCVMFVAFVLSKKKYER